MAAKDAATVHDIKFRINLDGGNTLFARELVRPAGAEKNGWLVVVVHGGPGLADHTESFAGLRRIVDDEIASVVVFYDQLGCGESDKPEIGTSYSLQNYVEELRRVVVCVRERHAETCGVCLLGHSWGGQLVLELLLHNDPPPVGVRCAIISNTPLDESSYAQKQRDLRKALDEAIRVFYEQEEEEKSSDGSVGSLIYNKLIGKSETNITGEMACWSVRNRLRGLRHPCLFLSGDDDTIPFEEYRTIDKDAPEACRAVILEGGGHGPFYGHTAEVYFSTIRRFLLEQQGPF